MIDNDNWPMLGSRMEGVERRRRQESLEALRGLDLGDELVTLRDKYSLFDHQTAERVHQLITVGLAFIRQDTS